MTAVRGRRKTSLSTRVRIFSPQLCETGKKDSQKKEKRRKKELQDRPWPGEATPTFSIHHEILNPSSFILFLLHPMASVVYNGRLRYPPVFPGCPEFWVWMELCGLSVECEQGVLATILAMVFFLSFFYLFLSDWL